MPCAEKIYSCNGKSGNQIYVAVGMGIFQMAPPPLEMKRVLGSIKEGGGVVLVDSKQAFYAKMFSRRIAPELS